jgi:hypothetical protein
LGSEFARQLAGKYELLLTDRDEVGIATLAASLGAETLVADLTLDADLRALEARAADVDLLVNNAGFGTYSLFHEADLGSQLDMVSVHVIATMRLCRAALPGMVERGGAIINVASAGAWTRFPRDATYIGTKAFLIAFTECLAIEVPGVTVQALCPGWVRGTRFAETSEYAGYRSPLPGFFFTDPEVVVASSLRALARGSGTHVPTLRIRVLARLLGSRLGLGLLAWRRRLA